MCATSPFYRPAGKSSPVRDLYYTTSLKTCYTAVMSSQPAYRNRNHLSGAILIPAAAITVIAALAWLAQAPLRIWHVTGPDGKQHPDTATWIAYGICAVLVLAAMMAGSIRASRKGTSR